MNILKVLSQDFYSRPANVVAPELLGHWLLRRDPDRSGEWIGGPILEVEAYLHNDPACHAYKGQTARNRAMFGPPGRAYVYFIYGVHYCVNAVCMPEGVGEAVLIRAIEPRAGVAMMQARRRTEAGRLADGPGKVCAALGIGPELDGAVLCDPCSGLVIAVDESKPSIRDEFGPVRTSRRIGISKAAEAELRFFFQKAPATRR